MVAANIALMREALIYIRNNREIWSQQNYCDGYNGKVQACVAGIALKIETGLGWNSLRDFVYDSDLPSFERQAQRSLNLTKDQADELFYVYYWCNDCDTYLGSYNGPENLISEHQWHAFRDIKFNEFVDVVSEILEHDFSDLKEGSNA